VGSFRFILMRLFFGLIVVMSLGLFFKSCLVLGVFVVL